MSKNLKKACRNQGGIFKCFVSFNLRSEIQFTVIYEEEKLQILSFERLKQRIFGIFFMLFFVSKTTKMVNYQNSGILFLCHYIVCKISDIFQEVLLLFMGTCCIWKFRVYANMSPSLRRKENKLSIS